MHQNEAVLRKAIAAFQTGDMDTLMQVTAEDLTVRIPGSNQISGEYKSQQDFFGRGVGKIMELTDGQFQLGLHDCIADDEHGTGMYEVRATRDGKTLEFHQVNVYHFRDGRISEIWINVHEFEAWNKFFS